ncbi:MAG TPA: SDR family oxidoreductase [Membranihabitans sp.]|nr:SDR family oxidoreductase [Membranihabitans sp.]
MVVVITGASKGIGRAIAENLAGEGYDLALCARSEEGLHSLKEGLSASSSESKVITMALDVRDRNALSTFAGMVLKEFGRIDVLINNAGVFVPGNIMDETEETYDRIMQTNLDSAYFLTKSILPSMIGRKSGHIINMCSVASIQAYPNGGSYAISKHALHGFGKTLREEVRKYGIRVTNILPGATWTESWDGVNLPQDRFMDVRNVAHIVHSAIHLDPNTVMEEIVLRPVQGDI